MIIRKFTYNANASEWVHLEDNKALTRHFRYSEKTIVAICYSHMFKDLILSTNLDLSNATDTTISTYIICEELDKYYVWASTLGDFQLEHHGNIVRRSHYLGIADKIITLIKLLLP